MAKRTIVTLILVVSPFAVAWLVWLVFLSPRTLVYETLEPYDRALSIQCAKAQKDEGYILTFQCNGRLDELPLPIALRPYARLFVKSNSSPSFSVLEVSETGLYCAWDNQNLGIVFICEPGRDDWFLSGRNSGLRSTDRAYWEKQFLSLVDGTEEFPYRALPQLSDSVEVY